MDVTVRALFEPFALKSLILRNRIVMAPMTRYFSPGGVPTADVAAYYRRRAAGDVGLIITEGVGVNRPAARNHPGVPTLHDEAPLAGWRSVVSEVHAAGGRIAPQLWHVGSAPDLVHGTEPTDEVESPSGIFSDRIRAGRAMTDADIAETVGVFAEAACAARDAGFDCIELHGAHGYLFDQFFWDVTNRRADRFGGDWTGRTLFAAEVVRAVRDAIGPDVVIIMRVSQWKQQDYEARVAGDAHALEQWLRPLAEAGIDMFHCSQRRIWEAEFDGSDLNLAGWVKRVTGCPTIAVGSVGLDGEFMDALARGDLNYPASLDAVVERLARGEFDLVAVGRALLSDPDWALKVREGRTDELRPFHRDHLATLC